MMKKMKNLDVMKNNNKKIKMPLVIKSFQNNYKICSRKY